MKCSNCGKEVFGDIVEHIRTGCIPKTKKPKPNSNQKPKVHSGQLGMWPPK